MRTTNIYREISSKVPNDERIIKGGEPLFTAYGCVLLERSVLDKYYVYTAVNIATGNREVIARRVNQLTTSQVPDMSERIRKSSVAGAGRLQADRPFGNNIPIENCREMLTDIFIEMLPECGYAVRKEQIALAEHILDTIYRRQITLAEAEVGTGKTLAYLVAAIIAKRGRLNGYWNMSFYTGSPYVDMAHMPIIIATSSIALQKALEKEYIPELSRILMDYGIITSPLTTALRKGRSHYVCEKNLRAHILAEHNIEMKKTLKSLLEPGAPIDLAEIEGLTPHVKRKICVPVYCEKSCSHREDCAYMKFRQSVQSPVIDIQVCNHNYFLADTLRRKAGENPLIPNYQAVIIDEAHKFLGAARQMYGVELSVNTLRDVYCGIGDITLKSETERALIEKTAMVLCDENDRLFRGLFSNAPDGYDESNRFTAVIDTDAARHIRNILALTGRLIRLLDDAELNGRGSALKTKILRQLEKIHNQATVLTQHENHICWMETDDTELRLCAIPKDLGEQLYRDLWNRGIPTILTSGTLSAGGDFTHIKKSLGLELVGIRLTETCKSSPFDYTANSLLDLSKNVPFPDQRDKGYILAVANEIEQLVRASHGHAAVLFTSYKVMDMVWNDLTERGLPFPMFRMGKGSGREIDSFKRSGNGVLFAAGALWEGIDIPGDALSMLIIVKLPFAVPDPIGEYEQTLYEDMDAYKDAVIKPNMAIRLKQGDGRLIRTERDSGVVAILDCRVAEGGAYYSYVISALPERVVTYSMDEVEGFYRLMKEPEYYSYPA